MRRRLKKVNNLCSSSWRTQPNKSANRKREHSPSSDEESRETGGKKRSSKDWKRIEENPELPNHIRVKISMETEYKDLLTPSIKDIEEIFNIHVAELLDKFVSDLIARICDPSFLFSAMLVQGSASVYGKKVEYLFKLCAQFHDRLFAKKKDDQPQSSEKETKERKKKEDKFNDPFLSVEFKMGKNLSCLRKKNLPKTAGKKSAKKITNVCNPVHLLVNNKDDKGEVFYDTKGDIVGNKTDFAMNKCRLTSSGWLLLPSVNPKLVPSLSDTPDYYDDSDIPPSAMDTSDIEANNPQQMGVARDDLQSSLDDGFDSPPFSDVHESNEVPSSDINSENNIADTPCASTAPASTDEGIGSTPSEEVASTPDKSTPSESNNMDPPNDVEMADSLGNFDLEDLENVVPEKKKRNKNKNPPPDRTSVRRGLKSCHLPIEDDPLAGLVLDKSLFVRKKIQKSNTRRIPSRLKSDSEIDNSLPSCPISPFCQRAYFALEDKCLLSSLMNFDLSGFDQHSGVVRHMLERIKLLKAKSKDKNIDPIEDEQEIIIEGIETLQQDANEDNIDDYDLQVQDEDFVFDDLEHPAAPPVAPSISVPDDLDLAAPDPVDVEINDEIDDQHPDNINIAAQEECDNYLKEVNDFMRTSEITQRVHEWERGVKPFLEQQKARGNLDMNFLGSKIIDAFEDNNRKQTMTFRNFCKHKEKWEIHRYFMSLLPLANMGNVDIEAERLPDNSDEIYITLLSRKMHHIELEKFGHKKGSHS